MGVSTDTPPAWRSAKGPAADAPLPTDERPLRPARGQESQVPATMPVARHLRCAADANAPYMQAPSSSQGSDGDYSGLASLQDLPEYPRAFVIRRLFVFLGIVVGCACGAPGTWMAAECVGSLCGRACGVGCGLRSLAVRHPGVSWARGTCRPAHGVL